MEQTQQSKSKSIVWIAVIIGIILIAAKYYSPEDAADVTDAVNQSQITKTTILKTAIENPEEECMNANYCDMSDIGPERTKQIASNVCGSIYSGLPNYAGTQKEGQKCNDVPQPMSDAECVANPPVNYDGQVVISESNMPITCCYTDGTCQWGAKV